MLRAGICDLGTCDLKMRRPSVRPAPPAGPLCDSSAPGSWAASSARKSEGSPRIRHPARRLACVQRRIGQPAVRSVRGSLTCSVTVWRPLICRVYAPPRCALCRLFPVGAMRFGPIGRGVSARRGAARFPRRAVAFPLECCGVSGGVRPRFRRATGTGCRVFPARPSPRARAGARRRPSSRAGDPFSGCP